MLATAAGARIETAAPCVLDVGLSLGPGGLHWALALARVVPVWLPQAHWSIVDDPGFFGRDPRLLSWLTGLPPGGGAEQAFAAAVQGWRDARDALGLESREALYWHYCGKDGSVLPKDGDATVVERIEALAAGCDGRRAPAEGACDAVADSARDAVAIAAALACPHPVILSPLGAGDPAPGPARYLASLGVPCPQVTEPGMLALFRDPLLSAMARSGLAIPVASRRLRLAVVAVAAPRVSGSPLGREEDLDWRSGPSEEEAALWDDASAIWWEIP